MTFSTRTMSSAELSRSVQLIELKPGLRFSVETLKDLLPDAETALFFGKVYELDYRQLSNLLATVLNSTLSAELFQGDHSTELQDYLVDICAMAGLNAGDISYTKTPPTGEILPELWKALEVEVAKSIKDVAAKLESVVGLLPGKQGKMMFQSMMTLNKKRPTIGDHKAVIHHDRQKENLLILDVSGSMTSNTIQAIVDDVVALSYQANAHLAIVSNTCTYWTPGSYSVDSVLAAAEFGGTHYEELAPLFDRDWGVVITVADFDSSRSAQKHIASHCTGRIDQVLDISLVDQPTFLAQCVGQLAAEVKPLLVGNSSSVLRY